MEKLSNVTECCTRKSLEWHIVLSVSFADRETHFSSGLNDRKHINRLHEHENASHTGMVVYLLLLSRLRMHEWIASWCRLIKKKCTGNWRAVLKRVMAVVKLLCERGLPLRGGYEVFGSQNGNFLGLLEFLAEFDDFLADHTCRFGNYGNPTRLFSG